MPWYDIILTTRKKMALEQKQNAHDSKYLNKRFTILVVDEGESFVKCASVLWGKCWCLRRAGCCLL